MHFMLLIKQSTDALQKHMEETMRFAEGQILVKKNTLDEGEEYYYCIQGGDENSALVVRISNLESSPVKAPFATGWVGAESFTLVGQVTTGLPHNSDEEKKKIFDDFLSTRTLN